MDEGWAAKARALDRYRWQLLRERHTLLGSIVRFAREAFSDCVFGLRARGRLAVGGAAEPCDFLLLQSAPKVIALQRKKLLIGALRERGYKLTETALDTSRNVLAGRRLIKPPHYVPVRYFGYAAHAEWLVQQYAPRVLLNDRNGSLYSPFLRLSLNARGGFLVHLAHASTVESSRRLGMNDYDFYFLFGRSSLDALAARALRFGSSMAVLAGSHMIDRTYDLSPAAVEWKTLLLLGVGPDKEKEPQYQDTYDLVVDWARRHANYRVLVKRHPRSRAEYWSKVTQSVPNIELLPADCSLAEALSQASLVVNVMSNAVIEAGLAARPVIYANCTLDADVLAQERYFGRPVTTVVEFDQRVSAIEADYSSACLVSSEFSKYHLSNGVAGLPTTIDLLSRLHAGQASELKAEALMGTIEECH